MGAGIQRGDHLGVGETVMAKRTCQRDDMAAVYETPAVRSRGCVKMNPGSVLPKPGGHHVLGFLEGMAIDMVDGLAGPVVAPPMAFAGGAEVVAAEVESLGYDPAVSSDLPRSQDSPRRSAKCRELFFRRRRETPSGRRSGTASVRSSARMCRRSESRGGRDIGHDRGRDHHR